jgi:two-component system response regulator AtoC
MSVGNAVPVKGKSGNWDYLESVDVGWWTSEFVGASKIIRRLVAQAEIVAPHLRIATIEGESGVGKQTLARFLHSLSRFADSGFQRWEAREWLALAPSVQVASGFTYIERVDALTAEEHGALSRALKGIVAQPEGRCVLVASSEMPLRNMSQQGRFPVELAFRLNAVRFSIPPLRERREDIAPLARRFLDRIQRRYGAGSCVLTAPAVEHLMRHDWPGNALELWSVLESALLESTNGIITADDLQFLKVGTARHDSPSYAVSASTGAGQVLNLDAVIRQHVQYVLGLNRGNKLRTARQLGISRSTLYRILESRPV